MALGRHWQARSRRRIALAAVAVAAWMCLSTAACTEIVKDRGELLSSFRVLAKDVVPASAGSCDAANRLPFVAGVACSDAKPCPSAQTCEGGTCSFCMEIEVTAIGRDGTPTAWQGYLSPRLDPGFVTAGSESIAFDGSDKGVRKLRVCMNRAAGPTSVWVEDDGVWPRRLTHQGQCANGQDDDGDGRVDADDPDCASADQDEGVGECNDGLDNDADGLIDLADPDCPGPHDDHEAPASYARGDACPNVHFENPRVRDICFGDSLAKGPLKGEAVRVDGGRLMVTNVVATGFFLTDLDDQKAGRYWNSVFIFTFSKPPFIARGNILCWFAGGMTEHVGMVQVQFPQYKRWDQEQVACGGWSSYEEMMAATLPDPIALTDVLADEYEAGIKTTEYKARVYENSLMMKSFAGNVVSFTKARVAERFVSCDLNQNGYIDKGSAEDTCRDACRTDTLCGDLDSYFEYAQWPFLVDGKKKIYASAGASTKFLPLDVAFIGAPDLTGACAFGQSEDGYPQYACPPRKLDHVTGSLTHIYLCPPTSSEATCDLQFWVVAPRQEEDVVEDKGAP